MKLPSNQPENQSLLMTLLSGITTSSGTQRTDLLEKQHWHQLNNPVLNALADTASEKSSDPDKETDSTIESVTLPGIVYLPLQYRGKSLMSAVTEGQTVVRGEPVAYPAINAIDNTALPGLVSPVHGVVCDCNFKLTVTANRSPESFIAIKTDIDHPLDQYSHTNRFTSDWTESDHEQRLKLLVDYGITGHGGGGFLLANKLRRDIYTLIINAVECEPLISCDNALLQNEPKEILLGILALVEMTGCEQCLVATEAVPLGSASPADALMRAFDELKSTSSDNNIKLSLERVSFRVVNRQYPAGAERILIKTLTGKVISGNTTPSDNSISCVNVATCHALYPIACHVRAPVNRIVTVCGDALAEKTGIISRNFKVRLGTPVRHLLESAGVIERRGSSAEKTLRVLQGGPLCGTELESLDTPVTQQTNCIVATFSPAVSEPDACIRCTNCQEVCPVNLMPQELHRFISATNLDEAADIHLEDCLLCGYCDLVCPSHIPLTEQFRSARQNLREQAESRQLATQAEQRFAERQLRLSKKAEEKEKRQAQQRESATDASVRKQAIDAALNRVRARKQNSD